MLPFVKDLRDPEIVALAAHFSRLPTRPAPGETDPARFARGEALAKKLRCGVCHRSDFSGQHQVPRLAGQREDYLEPAMREFRDKPRPGGDTIMAEALRGVSDADISALAHFLARGGARSPGR